MSKVSVAKKRSDEFTARAWILPTQHTRVRARTHCARVSAVTPFPLGADLTNIFGSLICIGLVLSFVFSGGNANRLNEYITAKQFTAFRCCIKSVQKVFRIRLNTMFAIIYS